MCIDGFGPTNAEVMVIAESPGPSEDDVGTAMVGRYGDLIRNALLDAGIDPHTVYYTHAVSCRTPEGKTPSSAQLRECRHWVQARIKKVKPKFVLLIGNGALESALGFKGIKKARGNPVERDGIIYVPTYSPAYVLRDPRAEAPFRADMQLFRRLVREGGMPAEEGLNVVLVNSQAKVNQMLADMRGSVSVDIETNDLYPWDVPLTVKEIAAGMPIPEGKKILSNQYGTRKAQYILLMDHPESPFTRIELEDIIARVDKRLQNCRIITHNGKFDALWMLVHYGVRWMPYFDTMLAHFLLDENSLHSLKILAQVFLGAVPFDIDVEEKRTGNDLEAFIKYGAKDAYYTRKLKFIFAKMLKDDTAVQRVFHHIMMPCVAMFVEAEYHGVFIDTARMDDAEVYLQERIDEAEAVLNQYSSGLVFHKSSKKFVSIKGVIADDIGPKRQAHARINWGSAAQLGVFLYDHLGLPIIEKTAGGKPGTSESVLLRTDHPIAPALLAYRGAQKQLVSFIDGWRKYIVGDRLHPSFKLHGTVTGRLSCVNPNLQQVPRDKRIRTLITAPPGWTLLEADLSQIEMRIAAELSGDRALLEAYRLGIDVHWLTALREIGRSGALKTEILKTIKHITGKKMNYGDAINEMLKQGPSICEEAGKVLGIDWKEHRKKAKAINFGYLYGMWWKKFREYARDNYGVEITDEQAQDSRVAYFELYGDLPDWHRRQKRKAKIDGYVRSLSGRKRRLPAAMANDGSFDAQAAERQAINSPVQSFANDINLMAALQLTQEFGPEVVHLVGTVHDAVLVEVRNDMVAVVYTRLLEIMQRPSLFDEFSINMAVPIEADAELGPWGAGVSLDKWQEAMAGDTIRRKRRLKSKPATKRKLVKRRKVA